MGRIRSSLKPDASQVHAIEPRIEAVLENWGRWAAQREGAVRHVNQQFRQALRGARWAPCATGGGGATLRVDEAWRVEQTVCNPLFSPRYRTLLVEHYVHRRRPMATCALLHIHAVAYDAELWKAAYLFREAFNRKFPDYLLT